MKIIDTIQETSPRVKARIAGLFELLEALTSGFGQVIVPGMLVVAGNAAATAANILAHGSLFRLSILAALIGIACHIAWIFLFYELFKPVNRSLSLLAAFVGLVAIAIQACSSLFQVAPLIVMEAGQSFSAFNVAQLQALTLMFLRFSARAFNTYLAFFGIWCVLIGYLIFRSTFMPRIIGLLEGLAGLCWLTFIWPPLAHYVSPYNQILAGLGEISLMLWLLVMGVNAARWKDQAGARQD
jgi:Domain of unknown function (DUF4386)